MKVKLLFSHITLTIGLLVYPSICFSGERYVEFEMGESGTKIYFPMTQQEIKEEDALIARWRELEMLRAAKPPNWVTVFEYGETGHTIEFPMSGKEINQAEKQDQDQREQVEPKKTQRQLKR